MAEKTVPDFAQFHLMYLGGNNHNRNDGCSFQIQLLSVSAEPSVSAEGGYGATAERGVAHELLWYLAVDGRIFLTRCHLNRDDQ